MQEIPLRRLSFAACPPAGASAVQFRACLAGAEQILVVADKVVNLVRGDESLWRHKALGSILAIVDDSNAVVQRYRQVAWGKSQSCKAIAIA